MSVAAAETAKQRRVLEYLGRVAARHPELEGYEIVMIVGVAPTNGEGRAHLIEVDRKAFPSDDGRLHPIAFTSNLRDAGDYLWVAIVRPEELERAVARRDDSLLEILRGSWMALVYPKLTDLPGSAAEDLWRGLVELGGSVGARAGDTQ